MPQTIYGITAGELHDRIIESMKHFGKHMDFRIDDILDGHDKHPLEQVINSVILRVHLDSKRNKE